MTVTDNTQVEVLYKTISDLENSCDELKGKNAILNKRNGALVTDKKRLQETCEAQQQELSENSKKITELTALRYQLELKLNDSNSSISVMNEISNQNSVEHEREVNRLKQKINELENSLKERKSKVSEHESKIADNKKSIISLESTVDVLESKQDISAKALKELKTEKGKLSSENRELNLEIFSLKVRLSTKGVVVTLGVAKLISFILLGISVLYNYFYFIEAVYLLIGICSFTPCFYMYKRWDYANGGEKTLAVLSVITGLGLIAVIVLNLTVGGG